MSLGTLQTNEANAKQWPDFYSILDSSPDTDVETLRRSINTLYVKANEQSDHRELKTRFYNQVLTQKVLPQCRRILLNTQARQSYDQQWHLHRDGAETALSYGDFIREIAKDAGAASTLLLSDDEISILPSFGVPEDATERAKPPVVRTPAAAPTTLTTEVDASEVVEGEEVTEAENPVSSALAASRSDNSFVVSPSPTVSKRQKPRLVFPLLGGLLVLGIGGFFWNASRQEPETGPVNPVVATAAAPAAPRPVTQEATTAHPFVFKADKKLQNVSLVGSFNNWSKTANLMVADADGMTWRLILLLKPGRYVYKFAPFAPQEQTWVVDPKAPLDPTDKINRNSLLIIR